MASGCMEVIRIQCTSTTEYQHFYSLIKKIEQKQMTEEKAI